MKTNWMGLAISLVCIILLLKGGCPKYTEWRVEHIKRVGEAERQVREYQEAKKGPRKKSILVGSQPSIDIVKDLGLENGSEIEFTTENSPGVYMLAIMNEGEVMRWNTDHLPTLPLRNHLRFCVDELKHPPGTLVRISYWKKE